jgi:coenzyme F420 hydrogenase subunit beta
MRVCPGARIEGLPENLVAPDSKYDEVWGIWREIVLAWSADPDVRHIGSTGGLLTALGLYLIESDEVDFLVHATASERSPSFGRRLISRTRDDVMGGAGSRYGPTATLIDVLQILDNCETSGETFAFIGTPCDVTALRNLATEDERVSRYCKYQLAMVCGGFMAPSGLQDFLAGEGISFKNITALRYRGYGCPGPTRIETAENAVTEFNYVDFWGDDESTWKLPFRCKVCADGIGDAADIAASDTWNGGSPPRYGQDRDPGFNAALIRTIPGQQLIQRAVDAGYVSLGDQLTPRDMDRFQPHQKAKKKSVWSRFAGMRAAGNVVPDVHGLRLKPLARTNSFSENLDQARGARKRCHDGKNREATPISIAKMTNEKTD